MARAEPSRPPVGLQSASSRPPVGLQSASSRRPVGLQSTSSRRPVGLQSASSRRPVGVQSASQPVARLSGTLGPNAPPSLFDSGVVLTYDLRSNTALVTSSVGIQSFSRPSSQSPARASRSGPTHPHTPTLRPPRLASPPLPPTRLLPPRPSLPPRTSHLPPPNSHLPPRPSLLILSGSAAPQVLLLLLLPTLLLLLLPSPPRACHFLFLLPTYARLPPCRRRPFSSLLWPGRRTSMSSSSVLSALRLPRARSTPPGARRYVCMRRKGARSPVSGPGWRPFHEWPPARFGSFGRRFVGALGVPGGRTVSELD